MWHNGQGIKRVGRSCWLYTICWNVRTIKVHN